MQYELSHVRIDVRDLPSAVEFYVRHLGMEVSEQSDAYAFLTNCHRHHVLALYGDDPGTEPRSRKSRIDHVAFEVKNEAELAQAYESFRVAGVAVDAVDNGISWSLYLADPDGNRLEVFCDRRSRPGGATMWKMRRHPLDVSALVAARHGQ